MDYQEIVAAINISIAKNYPRFSYHEFFIGFSYKTEESIRKTHNLSNINDWCVCLHADSFQTAINVINYFSLMGMGYCNADSNATQKFDDNAVLSIYCYKMTVNSNE